MFLPAVSVCMFVNLVLHAYVGNIYIRNILPSIGYLLFLVDKLNLPFAKHSNNILKVQFD